MECEQKKESIQPWSEVHSSLRTREDIPESGRKKTLILAHWLCSETVCMVIIEVLFVGFSTFYNHATI